MSAIEVNLQTVNFHQAHLEISSSMSCFVPADGNVHSMDPLICVKIVSLGIPTMNQTKRKKYTYSGGRNIAKNKSNVWPLIWSPENEFGFRSNLYAVRTNNYREDVHASPPLLTVERWHENGNRNFHDGGILNKKNRKGSSENAYEGILTLYPMTFYY